MAVVPNPPGAAWAAESPEVRASLDRDSEDAATLSYVGHSLRRADAMSKLKGRTSYVADRARGSLLHARLVVSPHAHARVLSIDVSAAEGVPGVVRVLRAADLPLAQARSGLRKRDPLAWEEVHYNGHPVAVVLAESEPAAEDGVARVVVEYEPLPAVLDIDSALAEKAPRVGAGGVGDQEEAALHGASGGSVQPGEHASLNVSGSYGFERGDPASAFARAEIVLTRTFTTSSVHQGYLEPQAALAKWDDDNHVTVWASTQALFYTRAEVAAAMGLPQHGVKVVPLPVGGGFGGKLGLVEPLVAACARAAGQPVRLVYTRSDEFLAANPAPSSRIQVRLAAGADGMLTALHGQMDFDTGASASSAAQIASGLLGGHYRFPHMRVQGREVQTHKTGCGSYRAPGAVQAHFAVESIMDDLARHLHVDAIQLRLAHATVEGDVRPDGSRWPRIGFRECLERAAAHALWKARATLGDGLRDPRGRRLGVGVAGGGWPGSTEPAIATCRLDGDGGVTVLVGAVDVSGTHTGFRLIAAETIGVHPSQVNIAIGDSDLAPHSGASGGSKITYTVGAAVALAAADARDQIVQIAANYLEAAPSDLEIVGTDVRVRGLPARAVSLRDVAGLTTAVRSATAPVFGRGATATAMLAPGFAVQIARVAVDEETGGVEVLDFAVIQDVGRAINPAELEAQVHGAVVQGIGWALHEAHLHDDSGQVVTGSLLDYALPGAAGVPAIECIFLEVAAPHGPFGARGIGEPPVIPVCAAIANAIRDAVGVRLTDLPMTPERVLAAMRGPAVA